MIKICAVGGYQNIGRNMTFIQYDNEAVILDMGLDLENYIELTENEDAYNITAKQLRDVKAIPDDSIIKKYKNQVLAIIPTHAHLDHIGAIPFLASKYRNAKIICTAYSKAVLSKISEDDRRPIKNKIRVLDNNSKIKISKNFTIEFVNVTHSTPDTEIVLIHTPKGSVAYANDFKFDNEPLLGEKSNIKRLKKNRGVKLLIIDSLYAELEGTTPGEKQVEKELKKIFESNIKKNNIIIATTFASHISRLKTLIDFAKKHNRKPIFLGRSLYKYSYAAKDAKIIDFSKDCDIIKYSSKIKKTLNKIKKEGINKYFIICTGHQAEQKAALSKIIRQKLVDLGKEDLIIFSSSVIPTEDNIENFKNLEDEIKLSGAKIFKEVHVSGHGSREDHKRLINILKPKNIIPAHSTKKNAYNMKDLSKKINKNIKVHILKEGDFLKV